MISKFIKGGLLLGTMMPVLALAQASGFNTIQNSIDSIIGILGSIVPLLVGLGVVFFIYSLVQFMLKAGDEKAKAQSQMIWGIIILAVMVSVWGLVKVVQDSVGLDRTTPVDVPELPTS